MSHVTRASAKRQFITASAVSTASVGIGMAIARRIREAAPAENHDNATTHPAESPHDLDPQPVADDLDREQINQLHAATLKASDSCFELKKLCATVLVPTGTFVALFTHQKLDDAVFLAGLLVIVAFWLADAVGYFYQRQLRNAMAVIWARRAARCAEAYDHAPAVVKIGPLRAAFNSSMVYYLLLAVLVGIAFTLFHVGVLG